MAKSYETARLVLKIISVVGWVSIGIGVIVFSAGFMQTGYYPNIWLRILSGLPGLGIAISGLFSIGFSEIGLSVIDGSLANQEAAQYLKKLAEAQEKKQN